MNLEAETERLRKITERALDVIAKDLSQDWKVSLTICKVNQDATRLFNASRKNTDPIELAKALVYIAEEANSAEETIVQ